MLNPVQTFWIEPEQRWLSDKYAYFSIALSCHLLREIYGRVTLYTDVRGAELLVGKLNLPYSRVVLSLEGFEKDFDDAWVMNKMLTYALQDEPFLHVDTDAYLFAPLNERISSADVIVQNFEYDHPYYVNAIHIINNGFSYVPEISCRGRGDEIWAVNAGFVGGHNLVFFRELYAEAQRFLSANVKDLAKLPGLALNTYLEQYLLKQLSDVHGLTVEPLLGRPVGPAFDYHLHNFSDLPNDVQFLHALSYKRNPTICEFIGQRLWLESPGLYQTCLDFTRGKSTYPVVKITNRDKYDRTVRLLAKLNILEHSALPEVLTEKYLKEIIWRIENYTQKALLTDLFTFEKEKWRYFRSISKTQDFESTWESNSKEVNNSLKQPLEMYWQRFISKGDFCTRISSRWNWSETNEFSSQATREDFDKNIQKKSAYFEVLIYYSHNLGYLREYLLDYINILIFDEANAPVVISKLIEQVVHTIRSINPAMDANKAKVLVDKRIRYFLYNNTLKFCASFQE